jgi:hypothetical protein
MDMQSSNGKLWEIQCPMERIGAWWAVILAIHELTRVEADASLLVCIECATCCATMICEVAL